MQLRGSSERPKPRVEYPHVAHHEPYREEELERGPTFAHQVQASACNIEPRACTDHVNISELVGDNTVFGPGAIGPLAYQAVLHGLITFGPACAQNFQAEPVW